MRPDVLLSRTPQVPSQKHTSEHLFYRAAPSGCFPKCQLILLERQKQKQFFIPPLCLIRLKSCNCIRIKIFFLHIPEKNYSNPSFKSFNVKYGKPLIFTFYFKTSLIINELVKHENKFNRKVFQDRENSENRFSEFSYFMKGFKKYIKNIYRWFTQWNYREIRISWNALKEIFQCILAFNGCSYVQLKKSVGYEKN